METAHQELGQTFSFDQNRGLQKASWAGHGSLFGPVPTYRDVQLEFAVGVKRT
jgi:hypothetical protein